MNPQPDRTRGNIGWVIAILLGLGIGFLIRRVHIGLLIGVVLGLIASVFMKRR